MVLADERRRERVELGLARAVGAVLPLKLKAEGKGLRKIASELKVSVGTVNRALKRAL